MSIITSASILSACVTAALVFGTATSSPKPEAPPLPHTVDGGVSMRVLWSISEYKVGENAVWGEEEARKLLFKPLEIDSSKITFDGRTCHDVMFEKEMVSVKEYLDRVYQMTPQSLGIEGDEVEVVKTNCTLPGFAEYMRLRDRRLIIHLKGVFFYFEPGVNY